VAPFFVGVRLVRQLTEVVQNRRRFVPARRQKVSFLGVQTAALSSLKSFGSTRRELLLSAPLLSGCRQRRRQHDLFNSGGLEGLKQKRASNGGNSGGLWARK